MIRKLHNISIRGKLILMQVFTAVLVLVIVFGAFVITQIQQYKLRKQSGMESLAQLIAVNSVSTLEFLDQDAATQNLSELRKNAPDIAYAFIVDRNKKIFSRYARNSSLASSDSAFHTFYKASNPTKYLYIDKPIMSANKQLGSVLLKVDLIELDDIKDSIYKLAAILLLVALALSLLVASIVESYISKRLLRLVKIMKDANKTDNYDVYIRDDGKDEIGSLFSVYRNLMEQVSENQKRKDEFIGVASHELKTPLTTIKGYLQLLDAAEDDPAKKQLINKANNSANKLSRLISELLDVSKIQSGQLLLNIRSFKLEELLQENVAAMQLVSPSHQIINNVKGTNFNVMADQQRIEQVLTNLLSNAVKYSPAGSSVLVGLTQTEKEYTVSVRDFGTGITTMEKESIFDRFYRARDVSSNVSGFGLGLYICKNIIDRHNGKIWAEPLSNGSVFCFSLPKFHTLEEQVQPATVLVAGED